MKTYEELNAIMEADPNLFDGLTPAREIKFKKWLPLNMEIYREFVRYAKKLKEVRHREYYSARTIWEVLRWETLMADNPDGHYKMSDLNMPFISWLVMEAEPELTGMFRKRVGNNNED
jgi:hypothetical protein